MVSATVRVTVEWRIPFCESKSIADALHSLMGAARVERGCIGCSLSTDAGDRATLRYVESWETEGDLKRTVRSERFARLAGLVEGASEPPTIEFTLPGGTRGLEYAEEVRRERGP
jgi:quinol monooxygenase YgiN